MLFLMEIFYIYIYFTILNNRLLLKIHFVANFERSLMQYPSKFMKIYFSIFFVCVFCSVFAQETSDNKKKCLFVSLGSVCEPAHMLRFCELREKTFPFDWIVSMDGEALIEMLENDFKDLFRDEYFVPFGPAGHLLQTYYHLEFLHDGDFNHQFEANLEKLKQKYQRRIARFKQLDNYEGKVFFIRFAYAYSMNDPHRFFKFEENLEITERHALRLHKALKFIFPNLDFHLLIINCCDGKSFQEPKRLNDSVRIFRANPYLEQSQKIDSYRAFFNAILAESVSLRKTDSI